MRIVPHIRIAQPLLTLHRFSLITMHGLEIIFQIQSKNTKRNAKGFGMDEAFTLQ